jgi:hypothetical protein
MNEEMNDAQMLTIITHIVEKHGCRIKKVDIENHLVNLEGPEDAKVACAIALAEVLG